MEDAMIRAKIAAEKDIVAIDRFEDRSITTLYTVATTVPMLFFDLLTQELESRLVV